MDKQTLKALVEQQSMPKECYWLEGGLPNEAYCLQQTTLGWEVYYSERGNKTGLETFPVEETACDYLYQLMLSEKVFVTEFCNSHIDYTTVDNPLPCEMKWIPLLFLGCMACSKPYTFTASLNNSRWFGSGEATEIHTVRRQVKPDKRGENGKRQFSKLFHLNHLGYVPFNQKISAWPF